jgi:histidyl-tRNA synthetase
MRDEGSNVDIALHPEKPKHFFARTGKAGFRRGIYIGPDDMAKGTIRLKNLEDRTEQEIILSSLGV